MKIEVRAQHGLMLAHQTRAYAEYRVFSAVAVHCPDVAHVTVALAPAPADSAAMVQCVVTLVTPDGSRSHVRADGRHPYEAIDRAAERTSARGARCAMVPATRRRRRATAQQEQ